jgi:hypothetical protein
MNLHSDRTTARLRKDENHGLWQDGRVWWVNCVALEAAWVAEIGQKELPSAQRQRDLLLTAFIHAW